jgi:hypothetical protein
MESYLILRPVSSVIPARRAAAAILSDTDKVIRWQLCPADVPRRPPLRPRVRKAAARRLRRELFGEGDRS